MAPPIRLSSRGTYKQVEDDDGPAQAWYVFMAVIIGVFLLIVVLGSAVWGGDQRYRRWDDRTWVVDESTNSYFLDQVTYNEMSAANEATLLALQASITNLTARVSRALASMNSTL